MQDDLFRLIRSLTRSEKRYFTLHASTHRKDARHLELFRAIDRQKVYDEGALRRLFREKGYSEHLGVAKGYLHGLIMKALRSYHAGISQNARVKEMLRDVEILRMRGLHDQSARMLDKAAAIAESNNFHYYLLEINYWRRDMLKMTEAGKGSHEAIDREYERLYDSDRAILAEQGIMADCRRAFDLLDRPPFGNAAEVAALRARMPEPILSGRIPEGLSYIVVAHLIYTRMSWLLAAGELAEHERCARTFIAHAESSPWRDAKSSRHLISGVNELMRNLILRRRYQEAAEALERFEELTHAGKFEAHPAMRAPVAVRFLECRFEIDTGLGAYATAVGRIPSVTREVKRLREHVSSDALQALEFQMVVACIGAGDTDGALRLLKPMLDQGPGDPMSHRHWNYAVFRMLQLLIHFERGDDDLLEYLLKSYYRLLAREEHPYRVARAFLRFLRSVLRQSDRRALRGHLESLAAELRELLDDPFERWMPIALILAWAESRIEGVPLAETTRRYAVGRAEAA